MHFLVFRLLKYLMQYNQKGQRVILNTGQILNWLDNDLNQDDIKYKLNTKYPELNWKLKQSVKTHLVQKWLVT